jgi:acetyl esterase/lipase
MNILAYILAGLSFLMSVLLPIRLKKVSPVTFAKLFAGALSPVWAMMGVVSIILGWKFMAFWAIPLGVIGAGTMCWYVWQCSRNRKGFAKAFGAGWSEQIPPEHSRKMLKRRWTPYVRIMASTEPTWERDIPFWTIPGTDRQLLCDVWSPPNGEVSGLGIIFLHGSGWGFGDKDMFTRPLFHHLTAQGHTVMDVAYRLIPEVDIYGMIADIKRAIAWLKTNASRYKINPEKIVLGGGSAGCHLALLAAYTPQHPAFTPKDVKNVDLSVCGAISLYGPTDLASGYKRWLEMPRPDEMRYVGRMDLLLGGEPQDVPDTYRMASPATHVRFDSPATLLIQGSTDVLVPTNMKNTLCTNLLESGVPVVDIVLPWTEHMFDLVLPQVSPPAQSALYDVDRFLALLSNNGERKNE